MPQSVSNAVARRDKELQLVNWLRDQQDDLAMAAASHLKPATIVRIAQGALRKDDKLMAAAIANPQSLIHCLLDAARLGHEPGTDQYWLIPFGSEVTGIEGYKGIIERMFRAGGVSAVVAEVVRQKDAYRSRGPLTPPLHEFDEFADPDERGPLKGVYAYARMFDGQFSRVIPMGRAEIMKHKAASKGSNRSDSPWNTWEESMWKKTPLRALEAFVPTSSEWLDMRARAAVATGADAYRPSRLPAGAEAPRIAAGSVVPELDRAADPEPQPEPPAPRQQPQGRGRRQPVQATVVPDDDAPWPDGAAPAQPGQPAAQPAADPRNAIIRALAALGVTSSAGVEEYVSQLTGHAGLEQLPREDCERLLARLASCKGRGDLDAMIADGTAPGE